MVINLIIEKDDTSIQNKINTINEMKRYIWENNTILDDTEIASEMYGERHKSLIFLTNILAIK